MQSKWKAEEAKTAEKLITYVADASSLSAKGARISAAAVDAGRYWDEMNCYPVAWGLFFGDFKGCVAVR